jgi:hypothetical protein
LLKRKPFGIFRNQKTQNTANTTPTTDLSNLFKKK